MASGAEHLLLLLRLKNLIVHYEKCPNKFGEYVEKYSTTAQTYMCAFLVSSYLQSPKKKDRTYFLTYPHTNRVKYLQ
jgi:hypothetical protein